jgi:hypothetical protein
MHPAILRYVRAEKRAGYARQDRRCNMFARQVIRAKIMYGFSGNPY